MTPPAQGGSGEDRWTIHTHDDQSRWPTVVDGPPVAPHEHPVEVVPASRLEITDERVGRAARAITKLYGEPLEGFHRDAAIAALSAALVGEDGQRDS
jgi:hypothetical protein